MCHLVEVIPKAVLILLATLPLGLYQHHHPYHLQRLLGSRIPIWDGQEVIHHLLHVPTVLWLHKGQTIRIVLHHGH